VNRPNADTATGGKRLGDTPTPDVTAYAAAVASREPAPGGGSVVGVTAALAAALGAMVCRFTLPVAPDAATDPTLGQVLDELDRLRSTMLDLAAADAAAYGAYQAAVALPKATDQERQQRRSAMQSALVEAIEVPLAVARGSARIRSLLSTVAEMGNPHLRSDAVIGGFLADAALRGALVNVRGNAALLKDVAAARAYLAEADAFEAGR
jgi:formiminotetrahydrofolate cyclodeaminase